MVAAKDCCCPFCSAALDGASRTTDGTTVTVQASAVSAVRKLAHVAHMLIELRTWSETWTHERALFTWSRKAWALLIAPKPDLSARERYALTRRSASSCWRVESIPIALMPSRTICHHCPCW